jgi:hypothetical protein
MNELSKKAIRKNKIFYDLFKCSHQIHRFYVVVGAGAVEFSLWLLPKGYEPKTNYNIIGSVNEKIVRLYSISEGWLHKGPWIKDFNKIVKQLRVNKKTKEKQAKIILKERRAAEKIRIKKLLDNY